MWFESYQSKRTQYVKINNFKSSPQTITTGVPQSSISRILFFLIYKNDMRQASNLFKFILYADDTTLLSALDYSLSLDIPASSEIINRIISCWGTVNGKSLIHKYYKKSIWYSTPDERTSATWCLNSPWMEKNRISR